MPRSAAWPAPHGSKHSTSPKGRLRAGPRPGFALYNAAWRRGLTTPEIDALAVPSSLGERHANGYWVKEGVFRQIRKRLAEARLADPGRPHDWTASSVT